MRILETAGTIVLTLVAIGACLYVGFYEQLLGFIVAMGYVAIGGATMGLGLFFVASLVGISYLWEKRTGAKIANQQALVDLGKSAQIFEQVKAGHALITNVSGLEMYAPMAIPATPSPLPMLADNAPAESLDIPTLDVIELIQNSIHIALQGPTQSGKSTLAIELMNRATEPLPSAMVAIVDTNQSDWPIPITVDEIDNVLPFLAKVNGLIEADKTNNNRTGSPKLVVVDEHDDNYNDLGKDYIKGLKKLYKVGAKYQWRLILLGQSPLSTENGLTQSSWRNFTRIIFASEAMKFINSAQFAWRDMKRELLEQLQSTIENGQRGVLVVPASGVPVVRIIGDLSKTEPSFEPEPLVIEANFDIELSDFEAKIIDAHDALIEAGSKIDLAELYRKYTGKAGGKGGGAWNKNAKRVLTQYRPQSPLIA